MDYITLGSVTIEAKWLVLALSLLLSLIPLQLIKSKYKTVMIDAIVNSLFVGFFVLKISLILIRPAATMRNPLSLLYFTGGEFGFWLGVSASMFSFFLIAREKKIPFTDGINVFTVYLLCSFTLYHMISIVMEPGWEHALNLFFSIFILFWMYFRRQQIPFFSMALGFAFYQLVLANLFENTKYFLSEKQIFFTILILFLLASKKRFTKNLRISIPLKGMK